MGLMQLAAATSVLLGGQFMTGGGNAAPSTPVIVTQCGSLGAFSRQGKSLGLCPLEKTTVNAQIDGFGAEVTVVQKFKNTTGFPIEAVYTFPLPNDSAVGRMRIRTGDRIVEGSVRKREEARQIYEQAKKAGQVAALLDQERENIFTQQVANINPGATVEVEITYVQLLKYIDGEMEFSFPMVVGPRFLGNAKDADKINPPREERPGTNISIDVDIHAGGPIKGIRSVLHEIDQSPTSRGGTRVKLRRDDEIPNKDFILRYAHTNPNLDTAFVTHTDKRGGFFSLVVLPPKRPTQEQVAPREMIFVMDQSGSQNGFPIEKSKELTLKLIGALRPNDTFNVLGFNNTVQKLWDSPRPLNAVNQEEAHRFVQAMGANGGTQLRAGVVAALSSPPDPRRLRIVLFNTDGFIGDEQEVLKEIRARRNSARMFTFGIGNSVNRMLIDAMAAEGRGDNEYVTLAEGADLAANRFIRRISTPVLTDVTASFSGVSVNNVQPDVLPDVFLDRPLVLHGRFTGTGKGSVTLKGKLGGQPWTKTVDLNFGGNVAPAIPVLWARQQVSEIQRLNLLAGKEASEPQITRLGLEFGILTAYTSFVAVDKRVVNSGGRMTVVPVPVAHADGVAPMALNGYRTTNPLSMMSAGLPASLQKLGSISLILSGGRGNSNVASSDVSAEAILDDKGQPAIRITWKRDLFFRGNSVAQWQVFRDDVPGAPIGVVDGNTTSFVDTNAPRTISFFDNKRDISELVCEGLVKTSTTQNGLVLGRPHTYSVAAVYGVKKADLPTTTGAVPGQDPCYFRTTKAATVSATALERVGLVSPGPDESVAAFREFSFHPAGKAAFPIRVRYVLQLSASPKFDNSKVFTSVESVSTAMREQQIALKARFPGDTFEQFLADVIGKGKSGEKVYWRIGARNDEDVPGPQPDPQTGMRFVFSEARAFVRP